MEKFISFIIITFFSLVPTEITCQSFNWEQILAPIEINEIKAVGTYLFVKSDSSLYRSNNEGMTWEEISSPPYTIAMNHLEPVENLGQLFISARRGLAVYDVDLNSTSWSHEWSLDATTWSCFSQSGEIGYSTIRSFNETMSGVHVFSNGSWNRELGTAPNDIPHSQKSCQRVICNPSNPEMAYVRGTNLNYRTDDMGTNWYEIPYEVIFTHNFSGAAYTLAHNNYSLDNGFSWNELGFQIDVVEAQSDTLFAGQQFGSGVYAQFVQNLGESFIPIGLEDKEVVSLEISYPYLYAVTSTAELFRLNIENLDLSINEPGDLFSISVDECRTNPDSVRNDLNSIKGVLNDSLVDYSWDGDNYIANLKSTVDLSYGGVFYYLKGNSEDQLYRNFDSIFEPYIRPEFQGTIDSFAVTIKDLQSFSGNSDLKLRVEFKDKEGQIVDAFTWNNLFSFSFPFRFVGSVKELPSKEVAQIVVVLDNMKSGDEIELDKVRLIARVPHLDTPTQAFLWSYNAILENLDTTTWMVKDKGHDPFGELEGVPATAKFAKNTFYAQQLGLIAEEDAQGIITSIADKFINDLPTGFGNLLPHFTRNGGSENVEEWSTVDHCISLLDLILTLELIEDPMNQIEDLILILENTDWDALVINGNEISHGFDVNGNLLVDENSLPLTWVDFGMETMAVLWAYASSKCELGAMNPPPGFGSGFIDNLNAPIVCYGEDLWGNDWSACRLNQANIQINWYKIYNTENPFLLIDTIFGLSAAETPDGSSYNSYRIPGFQGVSADDGNGEVIIPHYHGMIADIKPDEATAMWNTLRDRDSTNPDFSNVVFVSPWNVTESFRVDKVSGFTSINYLKSSWNLNLLVEGWANYHEDIRNQLRNAVNGNDFLEKGMSLLKVGIVEEIGPLYVPFKVYPIPTNGQIIVEENQAFSESISISLFNYNGQFIKSWEVTGFGNNSLDLEELPSGKYSLNFYSNGQQIQAQKIIKF